jgi:hypothetical protein
LVVEMATLDELREKAAHYRSLKLGLNDGRVLDALDMLADEYEALAAKLEGKALQKRDDQPC